MKSTQQVLTAAHVYRAAQRGLHSVRTLAFLVAFGLTANLFGQERFGEIIGTVTDPTKAAVPNATVTVTNLTNEKTVTATSAGDGNYSLRLDPGRYKVRISANGFSTEEYPEVTVLIGKTLRVDAELRVGQSSETVQVTDAAPVIDLTNTTVANNITAEEFDRLPKGRSFQSLALNSTSVNSGEVEGGIQVNGASGAENQFNIDGISVTGLLNGQQRQNALYEILSEVQVKTGGISAEYGGALGGVISAVSKSGGNVFHGDVHYYLSGNKVSAGPNRRLRIDPVGDVATKYIQDSKQKNDSNEIGYSLGGYFVKNKLYFFSAASPRYTRAENAYTLTDGSLTIPEKTTRHMLYNKVSYDLGQKLRGSFHWLWSPTKSVGTRPGYAAFIPNGIISDVKSASVRLGQGYFAPQSNYGGQIDYTVSPTTLLSVRGGRFWDNFKDTGLPDVTPVNYSVTAVGVAGVPTALQQGQGFNNVPRVARSRWDLVARTYVQADVSTFKNFAGTHNFKAGIGTQKNVNNVLQDYPTGGYINVFWNRTFTSSVPGVAPGRGDFGYYEYHQFGTRGTTGAFLTNFYFQDNWQVVRRLTLNLGLRFESETVPSFQRAIKDTAFSFGYGDKIAPRLGASYDLFGDGKVKLYGSWGRYYDWVKYELARGTFGGDYWEVRYRSLDNPNVFNLSSTNLPGRDLWNPSVPGAFRNRRVPGFDQIVDGIKPMSQDNINAGVEMQLDTRTSFRAGFVHNSLKRTIEDLGVLVNGDEVYVYGNPGEGGAAIQPTSGATKPFPMPKAQRDYTAMELQVTRRFGKFFGSASYVLSRLYGNYAGLANSDEIRTNADGAGVYAADQESAGQISRPGGNANRAWDIDELSWDSKGNLNPRGRLATDRPHVVKLFGSRTQNWGSRMASDIGVFFYAGSGTPLSTLVNTINGTQVFVNGRGDSGRTPFLTQTDLVVGHEFKMGEVKRIRLEFNALNLFNQRTTRHVWTELNRARTSAEINLAPIDLAKGYDFNAMIRGTSEGQGAFSPLFGQADPFNAPFSGRFMVKYQF